MHLRPQNHLDLIFWKLKKKKKFVGSKSFASSPELVVGILLIDR